MIYDLLFLHKYILELMGITQAILAGMASLAELCFQQNTHLVASRMASLLAITPLKNLSRSSFLARSSPCAVPVVGADHDVTVGLLFSPACHAHPNSRIDLEIT